MDVVLKYDPKADILTMKLREGVIRDEKLLDSDVALGSFHFAQSRGQM